jgi:RNA-binding protein
MEKLTGTQRKYLRGVAHSLKPVVLIGLEGLSASVIKTIKKAFDDHELIKIKFNKFKEEKKAYCSNIESETNSEMIGLIGNVGIFYKQHPDPRKRKIDLTQNCS